ncbi:isopenicillin N synthase family oxygenase [Rhodoferax lacus]|uniref:2-oxoglutarate-dependent ethylene/succinate-forming enzyme n=1 Tax=Rhodoferax lacus TaxID=2184758 RepID=A0A3E1RAB1_9BURK|nr:2OG-Fe(II) oxygenase family protein [Rhodoferax lacus]RFO96161.1 isopenicillin N synthase family oxygenase [Rhodoferax lacus]
MPSTPDAELPLIDIAPLCGDRAPPQRAQAMEALLGALSTVGFAVLRGHGVAPEVTARMRAAVAATFAAPRELYAGLTVQKGNYRGYVPLGYFTPNSGVGDVDYYEAWKLHHETDPKDPVCLQSPLYGPNRWPPVGPDTATGRVVDIRAAVLAYWSEMDRVNACVLTALCEGLGLDATMVLDMLRQPLTNMTLLNYPGASPKDAWGIHPHKDFNFLTFLSHDPVGGLEVRRLDGTWLDAHCPPDALVLNVGDMLELLSGGRLVSTPHRVVNRSGRQRMSFPYFSVPRHDVRVQPLLPPVPGFVREPLLAGAASANIWTSNWPDEKSALAAQDLGDYGG